MPAASAPHLDEVGPAIPSHQQEFAATGMDDFTRKYCSPALDLDCM